MHIAIPEMVCIDARERTPLLPRHCEERSDEAIQLSVVPRYGLLRYARNDGKICRQRQFARISALIMSAAFSPIMMVGALVLPPIKVGITEASTMRRPSRPRTFSFGSTTAKASTPILQVPTG